MNPLALLPQIFELLLRVEVLARSEQIRVVLRRHVQLEHLGQRLGSVRAFLARGAQRHEGGGRLQVCSVSGLRVVISCSSCGVHVVVDAGPVPVLVVSCVRLACSARPRRCKGAGAGEAHMCRRRGCSCSDASVLVHAHAHLLRGLLHAHRCGLLLLLFLTTGGHRPCLRLRIPPTTANVSRSTGG